MISSLSGVTVTAIESTPTKDLTDMEIEPADESLPDDAYGAINPTYRISDSPYLRLPEDMRDWPPIPPPEPREVAEVEDPTAVEIYNAATREVIRIPSNDTTQQPVESGIDSIPPYQGLLPPGIVPESVLPPDDRSRRNDTETYPWRTICKLFSTFLDGAQGGCSGAIIGCPDGHGYHVLTAGHCVYSHDHGGWATSVMVVPGLDDDYMPYNYAWETDIRSYTGWTVSGMSQHDWAVVTLDRNVGDYAGWMGRQTDDPNNSIYNGTQNVAGYPADKGGLTMWWDADNAHSTDEYNYWYYMDTYGGMSGSPVWRYTGTDRYILATHTCGTGGCGIDGKGVNHGTRLNQDKFDRIDTWCNADTPPTDKADLIDDGQAYSGFSPTTISPGDSFHVWCNVRNVGTESSGGFDVSYYASTNTYITTSDYLIGTDSVSSSSPFTYRDSDWSGTFPSIPAGTYYVGWIIDSGSDVPEFDETNNVAYKDSYQLDVTIPTCDGTDTSCGIHPNCENCNDYDGCYAYGDGCEERDYYCYSNEMGCDYTYSNRHTDYYDDWVYYCSGDTVRKHRLFHDFYCDGGTCTDHTSWVDDKLEENCNNYDGCYVYGDGCENRDYYCSGGSCTYTYSKRHTDYYGSWVYYCSGDTVRKHRQFHNFYCDGGTCADHTSWADDQLVVNCNDYDGWVDTGNTRWVNDPANECKEKEQKEQEYHDYMCSGGSCDYSVTDTQWVDTGNERNKPDGTICGCTANNTLKKCYDGTCTDTGICNSTICSADAVCDGNKPGDICGTDRKCNSTCNCVLLDTTSPSVTDANATPEVIPDDTDNDPRWGENSTLNVTVTDDSGVSGVTISLSQIGGSPVQPMTNIGGDIWSVNTNASAGTTPGTYDLKINATDSAGNSNTTVNIRLRIQKNGDVQPYDGNGVVDFMGDAMYLLRHTRSVGGYEAIRDNIADVTGDGAVDFMRDAMYLLRHTRNVGGYETLK